MTEAELLVASRPQAKGTGFDQPEKSRMHWHVDVSYLNFGGTFYFFISVLDGYSRYLVHWEICLTMKEVNIEMVVQCGLEKNPGAKPRIISDNGPSSLPTTSNRLFAWPD